MKPRVIELLLLTTVPVMFFAARGVPELGLVVATVVGGTLSSGSASALNCVYDRDIDEQMRRTRRRALPRHIVSPVVGHGLRRRARDRWRPSSSATWVNSLSAGLALAAEAFYLVVYTMLLKRRTTQNIVWGGLAGCFPALIGWTAVTGELAWPPVVLFLVVFFWTPPHTWALALRYREDYANVDVPMLPVVAPRRAGRPPDRPLQLGDGRDLAAAVAGRRHRLGLPGRRGRARRGVPGRGAPDVGAAPGAPRTSRVIQPMRLFHSSQPLPLAALRRGRARPAAHPLTQKTSESSRSTATDPARTRVSPCDGGLARPRGSGSGRRRHVPARPTSAAGSAEPAGRRLPGRAAAAAPSVIAAEISAAPSRWKPDQHDRQVGEVLHEADQRPGRAARPAAPATGRRAARGAAYTSPTVSPTNRKTTSAWSWLTLERVEAVARGVEVAGVGAGAGDDRAEVEHRPAGGEHQPGQRADAAGGGLARGAAQHVEQPARRPRSSPSTPAGGTRRSTG